MAMSVNEYKLNTMPNLSNAGWQILVPSVAASRRVVVSNINICNTTSNPTSFSMRIFDNSAAANTTVINNITIPANDTFYMERTLTLETGDRLELIAAIASSCDVSVSYIVYDLV